MITVNSAQMSTTLRTPVLNRALQNPYYPGASDSADLRFAGLSKKRAGFALMILSMVAAPVSWYLGVGYTKRAIKPVVQVHAQKAVEHTFHLVEQDIDDLKIDIKDYMASTDGQELNRTTREAGAIVKEQSIKLFQDIKKRAESQGRGENIASLKRLMDAMEAKDLKALEQILAENSKIPEEAVKKFKAELKRILKERVEKTHVKPEAYKPITDAAYDDIATTVQNKSTVAASGLVACMALFLAGMVLFTKGQKQELLRLRDQLGIEGRNHNG